jgi:RNA polymerase sigma factor (TIGR02999 family)
MESRLKNQITPAVRAMVEADEEAARDMISRLYEDLRGITRRNLYRLVPPPTQESATVVNMAYLELLRAAKSNREDSRFLCVAAKCLRDTVIDYHRFLTAKRRDTRKVSGLDVVDPSKPDDEIAWVEYQELLDRLGRCYPRAAVIVDLKVFGRLPFDKVAEELHLSVRQVKRDWKLARELISQWSTDA